MRPRGSQAHLGGLRHDVAAERHHNAPRRGAADGHVEEDFGGHGERTAGAEANGGGGTLCALGVVEAVAGGGRADEDKRRTSNSHVVGKTG